MSLRLENLKNLETRSVDMSIINPMKFSNPFKTFSPKILVLLLLAVGSGIVLMLGSIAGVGILGAFHHIASIYHSQTVEASTAFVNDDLDRLLKSAAQPQIELWQKQNLDQKDVATTARYDAAAWHWDASRHQLNVISATSSLMMTVVDEVVPFRQLVKPTVDVLPAYPGYVLPQMPKEVRWQISRQFVDGKAAWVMWAVPENAALNSIWGITFSQESLRPQLAKLLRRLCHDNFMKLALFDEQKKLLLAVNYQGPIKGIDSLVAGENQTFLEKPLGQTLDGMSMQIVYTPGIFGKIPHWALRTVIILIGLIGALMVGSIVYFYGLERTSSSQLQLQNDWVLNLAHTLRGPCHSLGVLTEAMKANANGELDELYLLARRELEAMDSHCRQFLQLARKDMKTAEMRIDSVAIKSLVETAIERVLTRYPLVKKDLVKPGELPEIMVKGNSAAAIETLMTVLDNAIKYSPEQKRISIACEHREKVLRLSVIDNGYGISAEDAAKVGTAFFRSSRSNLEGINGTGVGLYLAREACAAMGWEICIESEGTDKGTRVTFTIPVAEQ